MNMFYTTDISVTIWVFNKNKKQRIVNKNGNDFEYRDRTNEILFMDLRQKGHPFEKKYIEFTEDDRNEFVKTYHDWQSINAKNLYRDIKSYCKSVKKEDLDDYSLIPSKYIEFDRELEEKNYEIEMKCNQEELKELYKQEKENKGKFYKIMEELGYEL